MRLQALVRPGDPKDDPDFISRMRAALPRPPELPVAGAPLTYHDTEQAVQKGPLATSREELPRPLVSALPGFGLRLLVSVLEALASGTPSRMLSAILHLCLAKRLPALLVAQQPALHAGALPPAAGDGRCARSPGHPPRALARPAPGALRLSAAIVGPIAGPGMPLAAGRLGYLARGGPLRRLG